MLLTVISERPLLASCFARGSAPVQTGMHVRHNFAWQAASIALIVVAASHLDNSHFITDVGDKTVRSDPRCTTLAEQTNTCMLYTLTCPCLIHAPERHSLTSNDSMTAYTSQCAVSAALPLAAHYTQCGGPRLHLSNLITSLWVSTPNNIRCIPNAPAT